MTRPSLQRIRQPRVAEIVASRLRDDILSGRLKEGDVLPSQETLFQEFGVSPPALREAIWRPSATATKQRRFVWLKDISPRPAATRLRSAETKPLRPN